MLLVGLVCTAIFAWASGYCAAMRWYGPAAGAAGYNLMYFLFAVLTLFVLFITAVGGITVTE